MPQVVLVQMEGETVEEYSHRIFSTVKEWLPVCQEEDIPHIGTARVVWNTAKIVRAMTDDDLAESYFLALERHPSVCLGWEGVVDRSWLDVLRMERTHRYG